MTKDALLETARKKQLGQYFTDLRVGRLLAALADAQSAKTIIDPMVGTGNLLRACLAVGAKPDLLFGMDLDPRAVGQAQESLAGVSKARLVVGDAFSAALPSNQFDLVITNPPYIRYQSRGELDGVAVPSAGSVRANLLQTIATRDSFSGEARTLWTRVAKTYPSTSDIAVPAWILSAGLVRDGGVLAIVAPQVWLSRSYAHPVRELLDEAFDIEFIVEDGDGSWFDDAQVRTHLVIARRREVGSKPSGHSVVRARATSELDTNGSLRGRFNSEMGLVAALRRVTANQPVAITTGLTAGIEAGPLTATSDKTPRVPGRIEALLGLSSTDVVTKTIEQYGWRTGQGLRTGANDFFYVRVDGEGVTPATRWGISILPLPVECLLPAVRRQSDLGDQLVVDPSQLESRVVNLRGWGTPSDVKRTNVENLRALPQAVGNWVDLVASSTLSSKGQSRLFPELTAVATNVRRDSAGRPVSFWYQLPELSPRHRPAALIPRVCGGRTRAFLNPGLAVVDANFSTLWPVDASAMPPLAMLALLNSSWVWANLEAKCTVLGGGALKVEATDLRKLALPTLSAGQIELLTRLGEVAASDLSNGVQLAIDEVVTRSLVGDGRTARAAADLRSFAEEYLRYRSG